MFKLSDPPKAENEIPLLYSGIPLRAQQEGYVFKLSDPPKAENEIPLFYSGIPLRAQQEGYVFKLSDPPKAENEIPLLYSGIPLRAQKDLALRGLSFYLKSNLRLLSSQLIRENMDVYFYEAFEEEAASLRSLLGNKLTYEMTDKTIQETDHVTPPARLISIRTQSIIPIKWSSKLDGVQSRSTGYDHLKKYLESISTPLPCGYLEEYATRAVAEHAIVLMMSLLRKLPQQTVQFKHFNRDGLTGGESAGKNLLVVGVGRIGSEIAGIGSALRMNVRGVDIVQRHQNVRYTTKEEGITWADVIICAMNLTNENRGYFSYSFLKQAKPGILFINIARGEHAPISDMVQLVQEQHIGGLGLDVFEDEPNVAVALRSKHAHTFPTAHLIKELLQHPNVLFTPHNAFNTNEAVQRKSRFSVDAIFYFLKNKDFQCRVR